MASEAPIVGVVVGSDSDLAVMERCTRRLESFGIPYEVRVISAHRSPDVAHEYASTARHRGLKVLIAAAGMSAALSGVLASKTALPVIGVPMAVGPLVGVDAALSTMQLPSGIPVGCMAIGPAGATNAAIFAAQILATGDSELAGRLAQFKDDLAASVAQKDAKVQQS
ncbi:MAG: 5-(carboxyamino)imidazole ribonucleotide mutase [Planctomycetes bacterium]|jgi:phosphoribosylaminoimidazole carboxylase PurE protein|nr:5-(carboxyamino)imidazole ribonucleotide mutase [Phycisphaerae bacterium]NBB94991.1 5-(carboxyamino)imidazole ribonucleotide mutase [Planctomycetota bacterium]